MGHKLRFKPRVRARSSLISSTHESGELGKVTSPFWSIRFYICKLEAGAGLPGPEALPAEGCVCVLGKEDRVCGCD